ncbi:MAG: TMEM175 family protein [Nitrososphaerales archaeon]
MPKPTHSMQNEVAPHKDEGTTLGFERIVFFSDAVIAIAITLLVLDIRVPETGGGSALDLGPRLLALWPKYLGWAVSFWVIALYWVAHHRCYRYIERYDRRLMYLNFLFLMFIAFMPFPTTLLFTNGLQSASVILYAGAAAGMGLSLAGVWLYAARHRFVSAEASPALIRQVRTYLLLPPLMFVASAVLALFNAEAAVFAWLLLIPSTSTAGITSEA